MTKEEVKNVMKKLLLSIFILSFFITVTGVSAQSGNLPVASGAGLPSPGITPDNPFYFIKTWKESIQTFFTFGAENKAKQFLHLSEVRLAEYLKMMEKGKTEIAQKTLEKYKAQLNQALEKSQEAKGQDKDIEKLATSISEATMKHQEALNNVLEKVPEEAKETKAGIKNAIEAAQKGFDSAIQQKIEEGLKQASPEAQSCIKSMISKVSSGELKGGDIPMMLLNCLSPGTKIPEIPSGGGINLEFLKKIEEFYGTSLSPKDLESLKKAQEQLKGIIPQGTEIPSDQKTLNLEDVKKAQEKMQEELKKIPPEELERIKKSQEQQENIAPPEIPGDSSGMGL